MILHYDLTWDGHVFVFSSSARFHTLIHGIRMVGVVICYVHNTLINVITSLICCKWMTSCHHAVKAIEHVQEYPTMHYFGIPRPTQPMIAYGIWLSISGNSCCKFHRENVVCGGQQWWTLIYNARGFEQLWDNWSRSEEHTSELQSRETISYAVFCLKKKK